MGGRRGAKGSDARRGLRARGAACRGGDHDARDLSITPHVTVYHAQGCHLCERALEQVRELRDELGFALEEVDIGGDPELEAAHREWLPVVEIDGRRRFTYVVQVEAFRRAVAQAAASA